MKQSALGACICALVFGASLGMATGSVSWAICGAVGVLVFYVIILLLLIDPEWSEDDEDLRS